MSEAAVSATEETGRPPGSGAARGRVLIIAGSDSGGGAGIQADIKTVTALGGYAMTAITALTAQNTRGVFGILDVPPEFVARQMRAVLDDLGADCIKLGMLHRPEIVETVMAVLAEAAPDVPVVVDPVMVAKGGQSLLAGAAVESLRRLLPLAAVLTPNLPEAATLLDEKKTDLPPEDLAVAAARPRPARGPAEGWARRGAGAGRRAGRARPACRSASRARASPPATPTAPAARSLRPSPAAWPRVWRCAPPSSGPEPTCAPPSRPLPVSARDMARWPTATPSDRFSATADGHPRGRES